VLPLDVLPDQVFPLQVLPDQVFPLQVLPDQVFPLQVPPGLSVPAIETAIVGETVAGPGGGEGCGAANATRAPPRASAQTARTRNARTIELLNPASDDCWGDGFMGLTLGVASPLHLPLLGELLKIPRARDPRKRLSTERLSRYSTVTVFARFRG
jgi:hypothetical protein